MGSFGRSEISLKNHNDNLIFQGYFDFFYIEISHRRGAVVTDSIERNIDTLALQELIEQFPVTAILGAGQCGKTTLPLSGIMEKLYVIP
jgi:hypothetical protein